MGIRETQLFGLTEEAERFLEDNALNVVTQKCPHCGQPLKFGLAKKVYDKETGVNAGMFEDGPLLHEYIMKDGSKIREVVQAVLWSSGPCVFLCLENEERNPLFEWSQEEMDKA